MNKLAFSSAVLAAVAVVSGHVSATVASIKVDVPAFPNQVNPKQVCRSYSLGYWPVSVSCDQVSNLPGGSPCGSGRCKNTFSWDAGTFVPFMEELCDSDAGNDAIVNCEMLELAGDIHAVSVVECAGNCNGITLGQACGPSYYPYSVSCGNTAVASGYNTSCGTATCRRYGQILAYDRIGDYCEDGTGNDAIVSCSQKKPKQQAAVKVECWGSDCNNVTLGQICADPFPTPVSIACDDTATPGKFFSVNSCGDATCAQYGGLFQTDKLGSYCADGTGYDAIVTCSE